MIHVIATIELVPGMREAFLAVFRKLIADVRAEKGCIEYGPAIDSHTDLSNQAKVGPDKGRGRREVGRYCGTQGTLGRTTHGCLSSQCQRLCARRTFARSRPGRMNETTAMTMSARTAMKTRHTQSHKDRI